MNEYFESLASDFEGSGNGFVLLALFALLNAVSFVVVGWDKWCAKRGLRRIPEKTLLGLCALGGAIGTWSAMALFRHKTRKQSFRRPLIAVTLLNGFWVYAAYRILNP